MRKPSRFKVAAAIGGTAALVGASLMAATPAMAVQVNTVTYDYSDTGDSGINPFGAGVEVPVGVHWIDYTIQGGEGGDTAGSQGGDGGNPATVSGTILVDDNDIVVVYASTAGGDAGDDRTESGDGGEGWNDGGDGANSGDGARPGAGGGGSSAIEVNASAEAIAGGGGGGGGRGSIALIPCEGGFGGDAGFNGSDSFDTNPDVCTAIQTGGAAGANVEANGESAVDVPFPFVVNRFLGGNGGGGGGGGFAGVANYDPIIDNAGGAGGGGGASLGDFVDVFTPPAGLEDGYVTLTWEVAYYTETTAVVNPNPSAPGQNVTITATVENLEGTQDPTGTVDFGIAACAAQPLSAGVLNDSLSTATCTFAAGAPSVTEYPVLYNPAVNSIFGSSATTATVDIKAMLAATGSGNNAPLLIGGSALLLLMGGAFLAVRRVRVS